MMVVMARVMTLVMGGGVAKMLNGKLMLKTRTARMKKKDRH